MVKPAGGYGDIGDLTGSANRASYASWTIPLSDRLMARVNEHPNLSPDTYPKVHLDRSCLS